MVEYKDRRVSALLSLISKISRLLDRSRWNFSFDSTLSPGSCFSYYEKDLEDARPKA
jgi:hypothetical protein